MLIWFFVYSIDVSFLIVTKETQRGKISHFIASPAIRILMYYSSVKIFQINRKNLFMFRRWTWISENEEGKRLKDDMKEEENLKFVFFMYVMLQGTELIFNLRSCYADSLSLLKQNIQKSSWN